MQANGKQKYVAVVVVAVVVAVVVVAVVVAAVVAVAVGTISTSLRALPAANFAVKCVAIDLRSN